uniref:Signal peptidase complex subunit 3 n=1 Tax=Scophthalmus maximus TaxID=52904 RepID=A0A8D3AW07_SCOMX
MNTVLSRANSLFAFSLSVMAALTFGCFITTAFKDRRVPVDIHVSRVMLKNVDDFTGPRERSDLGFITFDLSADLQPIFDWNVKQLFLYLSAEYVTKSNSLNQVVLWDKIVLRGENTKLNLRDMKSKYFFFDDGNGLSTSEQLSSWSRNLPEQNRLQANKNITLTLSWNVVPNAGILPLVAGSGHVSLPFPDAYESTKSY